MLGALHSIGTIAVLVGLGSPPARQSRPGSFGWVILRQLRAGDRGRALGAYGLFTSMALAVRMLDAIC